MKYNYSDISKMYTRIVAEYLTNGCTLDTIHMSGSQGELSKIDLVSYSLLESKPNHLYRLLLEKETDYFDDNFSHRVDKVILTLRFYDDAPANRTVWNNLGEVDFKKTFYRIGKDTYTDSRQEAEDEIVNNATNG